jgi:voltage-gated potassium channel
VSLLTALIGNPYLDLLEQLVFIIFFILIAINLFLEMIRSKEVDSEVIFSAVAAYVLFGFCGALITAVIIFFQPFAFSLETTDISLFHQCLYFSFVTITTTGYGDIVPLTPMAKSLAIFLSVFGQLYLTVIIGILIGKYLSGREKI